MQLRKMTLLFATLGAMSMVLTGCPEDAPTLTCSTDTDCLESEICHPNAKVCAQKCTSGADCPDTAKTCAAMDPANTNSQKICQCSTTALCNTGRETADLVCLLDTYKVCAPKCSTDTDCATGQTCDTGTGMCKPSTTEGTTCSGEAQSTCSYGQFCSASKCTVVPAPTCSNFDNKPAKNFNPATATGNIIYNVQKEVFGTACGTDTTSQTVKARVSFYAKTGTLPTTKEGLSGFFYVRTTGSELDAVPLSTGYQRSADGKSASVSINLCTDASFNQIVLGFYFTGGNGYCATLTK